MVPARFQRLLTVSRGLLMALREAGLDVNACARQVGASSVEAPMTVAQADALLDLALAQVKDPAYALMAATHVQPELYGIVGLAAMPRPPSARRWLASSATSACCGRTPSSCCQEVTARR